MLEGLLGLDYGQSRKVQYGRYQGTLSRLACGCYTLKVWHEPLHKWVTYHINKPSDVLLMMFIANYPDRKSKVYKVVATCAALRAEAWEAVHGKCRLN